MNASSNESSGDIRSAPRRRLVTLILAGFLIIAVVLVVRILTTNSFDRWRAAHLTDQDVAKAAAAPDTSYPFVIEWAKRQEANARFPEAERIYARAMELAPTRMEAWTGFVRAAIAASDWRKAEQTARKAVELWPENAEPKFLLASILGRTFRIEQAARLLQDGLKSDSSKGEAWRTLGDLRMRLKTPVDAIEAYRKAVSLTPRAIHLRARLGEALGDAGRYDNAVTELTTALREDPNDMNARFNLGKALVLRARSEDRAEALLELNRVAHFSASKARAYYYAAHVWFREADYGNAAQALEHAYDENPFNADVLAMLVQVYERSGRKDNADKIRMALKRAQSAAADRKEILDRIGREESLVANLIRLGMTDTTAGNPVEAQSAFAAALLMDPGNREAADGIKQLLGKTG